MLPDERVQQPKAHSAGTQMHAQPPLMFVKPDALGKARLCWVHVCNPFATITLHPVWVQRLLEGSPAFDGFYSSGCWAMLLQGETTRSVICGNNEIQHPVSWIP